MSEHLDLFRCHCGEMVAETHRECQESDYGPAPDLTIDDLRVTRRVMTGVEYRGTTEGDRMSECVLSCGYCAWFEAVYADDVQGVPGDDPCAPGETMTERDLRLRCVCAGVSS
jgi:hypothetical protein